MRLFVFGGNALEVRSQFGRWPSMSVAALQDAYGISDVSVSFGVGWKDSDPIVIYREVQRLADRVYPFVVLIGPRPEDWRRFSWNPVTILKAARQAELWQKVRTAPEKVTVQEVHDFLKVSAASVSGADESEPLVGVLASASLDSRPRYVSPPDTSGELLDSVEKAVAALPVALRTGRGWLVGGARVHADGFGCRVVIDTGGSDDWAAAAASGHRLLAELTEIRRSTHSRGLDDLSETPVALWPPHTLDLLENVWLAIRGDEDHIDWSLWPMFASAPSLANDFVKACCDPKPPTFGAARTVFLMERLLDGSLPPDVDAHPWALREVDAQLRARSIRPSQICDVVTLSATDAQALWRMHLERMDYRPAEVCVALTSLAAIISPAESQQLLQDAITHAATSAQRLAEWRVAPVPVGLRDASRSMLAAAAGAQAHRRVPGWENNYVAFDDSPTVSGSQTELTVDPSAVAAAALKMAGQSDDRARQWLIALGASATRARVPIELKKRIVERIQEGWRDFRELLSLWNGQDVVPNEIPQLRDCLLEELRQLCRESLPYPVSPNLMGLLTLIPPPWPDDLVQCLRRRPRTFGAGGIGTNSWLEGWKILSPSVAITESSRLRQQMWFQQLANGDASSWSAFLAQASEPDVSEVLQAVLATTGSAMKANWRRLLTLAARDGRAQRLIGQRLPSALKDSDFCIWLLEDSAVANEMFARIDDVTASLVLEALYGALPDAFRTRVVEVFRPIVDGNSAPRTFDRAAARFLLEREQELATSIGRSWFGNESARFIRFLQDVAR